MTTLLAEYHSHLTTHRVSHDMSLAKASLGHKSSDVVSRLGIAEGAGVRRFTMVPDV